MGLGELDLIDDADGGGKPSPVCCSICLEAVIEDGDRSWAKLQCGHQFHLDCIGSAFNIKGVMQCPNCRKIEKGQWLFTSASRSFPDVTMDDWVHDEDLYDLSYSEMSFGVQWCPFSGLTRLPSSFDEGEYSTASYHDLFGQQAIFEHSAASSASHPCPYIAYVGPIHPSSSSSGGSVQDGSSFNSQWNGPSGPNEAAAAFAFPAMEVHYRTWEHHSLPFSSSSSRNSGADQPSVPAVTHRPARTNPDMPRLGTFMHHVPQGQSSAARTSSSVSASMIPPHPGSVARARDRVQALQAYFQQPSHSPPIGTPIVSGSRRSSTHRAFSQVGPATSSSDQTGGFYYFPSAPSGRNALDLENRPLPNRFHSWERENQNLFSFSPADRDPIWAPLHRPRHGSDRTQSQNR